MRKIFLFSLFVISVSFIRAQVTGSFVVKGDINNYYPVTFVDGGWSQNIASELEIGRSNVHLDGSWRGSLISKFRYHITNWGNVANFIDADVKNGVTAQAVIKNFIGGWADATSFNSDFKIVIWLRGGSTTYYYKANVTVSPVVYDGVTNPLPYVATGGTSYTLKTTADAYVNPRGLTVNNSMYVNGSDGNYFNGSVAIGAKVDNNYKLAVNGPAIFTKAVVRNYADWPDYVFDPAYKLPSLPSLESYIKEHRHLPGIPTAAEVEASGIDLGSNQAALLQKTEELTLYIIDQDKKIVALEAEREDQHQRLSDLEARLEALQQLLLQKDTGK